MSTTSPEAETPKLALVRKLHKIAKAITHIEKRGTNSAQGYSFVQSLDVTRDVRAQLQRNKLVVIPGIVPGSLQHFTETGGKSFVTTVDLTYDVIDIETGAELRMTWAGAGADIGGDKGLYKAMTGGFKYALMNLFQIPATNDPEHDGITQAAPEAPAPVAAPAPSTVANDAVRPAAPRIPLDRGKALADRSVEVGIAEWTAEPDRTFVPGPVLKALLAQLGVRGLSHLNVDQAEAVEAFLAKEATDGK